MTHADRHTDPTLAELERQIAETREQLGATVEELAAKADVPARAKAKAHETAARVRDTAHRAEAKAKAVARMNATKAGGAKNGAKNGAVGKAFGTASAVRYEAAGKAAVVADRAQRTGSHLVAAAHGVTSGTAHGTGLPGSSPDPWRQTYRPIAAGVTAAAGTGAVLWLRYRRAS
ncbi:MAG: hypothetical protein QOF98_1257 [Streptomyces sp.]|nr:hypothetical protein [Streptomyces sp.]